MTEPWGPGTVTRCPARADAITQLASSGSTPMMVGGFLTAAPVVHGGRGQSTDTNGDHDHVGSRPAGGIETVVHFPEHRRVALDDPARHPLVARPARIRDDEAAGPGFLGRPLYRVVVRPRHHGDRGTLGGNVLDTGAGRACGHEDAGLEAQKPGEVGNGLAVVPIRRCRQGEGPQPLEARRQLLDGRPRFRALAQDAPRWLGRRPTTPPGS